MKDIFCRIIDGEVQSNIIYEDKDVIAILDISQTTRGHTLVIPKEHYENFLVCPPELAHKVFDVAQRIGNAMKVELGAEGVNILTNVGEVAGQSVPHFHVHVIPRYSDGKGGFRITMESQGIDLLELHSIADQIKDSL